MPKTHAAKAAPPSPPPAGPLRPTRLTRGLAGEIRDYLEACEAAWSGSAGSTAPGDTARWCHDLRGSLETLLVQQTRVILSLHIPLAEPPGFRQLLANVFGEGFFLHYHEITDCHGSVVPDYGAVVRCIHGHFDLERLRGRFPQARLITWVRDPVQRVAAQYHYWRREPDWQNALCRTLHEKNLSLLEFARHRQARNIATGFLGKLQPPDFACIGLAEEVPLAVELLMRRLQVTAVPIFRDYQRQAPGLERHALPAAEAAEIARLNDASCRLYAECRRWFQGACGEAGIATARID